MKKSVIMCFFITVVIFCVLTVPVSAEETDLSEDWESTVNRFLTENKCLNDSVALGYYNTVTGEEHYYRGSEYMESGSTYKIPLNMLYAEKIYNGEMDFDTVIGVHKYRYLQQQTIVNSNNEYATLLWKNLSNSGDYRVFRTAIAPYMGVDPETVDPIYYKNRFFTAEQVMHCLKTLYSDPERFPGVIDCMLLAEQDNYFCYHPQSYPIAHKYGYISENGCLYICDSGICYTDDPIIIVMLTAKLRHPNALLADYCTLMCDYAERTRQERLSSSDRDAYAPLPEPVSTTAQSVSVSAADQDIPESEAVKENHIIMPLIILCAVSLAAITAVIISARRKRIRLFTGLLSVVFAVTALALSFVGMTEGTLFTRTEGEPRDTVSAFFDSVISGDYASAGDYLADYSDIGLDTVQENTISADMIKALRASYGYELIGECVQDGLSAAQRVRIRYLDFSKMSPDLQAYTNECIRQLVDRLSKNQIYDASGEYLDSFISLAFEEAAGTVLSHPEDYYSYTETVLDLVYRNDRWLMNTNPELLAALCGGN